MLTDMKESCFLQRPMSLTAVAEYSHFQTSVVTQTMLALTFCVLVCCATLRLANHVVGRVSASTLPVTTKLQLRSLLDLPNLKGLVIIPKYNVAKSATKQGSV